MLPIPTRRARRAVSHVIAGPAMRDGTIPGRMVEVTSRGTQTDPDSSLVEDLERNISDSMMFVSKENMFLRMIPRERGFPSDLTYEC